MSLRATVPMALRGEIIESDLVEFRSTGDVVFRTPDVARFLPTIALKDPSQLADVQELSCEDVVDYLVRLGRHLHLEDNPRIDAAFELSCATSGLPREVLRNLYLALPKYFQPEPLRALVDRQIGRPYLDSWVEQPSVTRAGHRVRIRAFGARAVHIIAGNVPTISALSIIRNALVRSDAILKTPANDPLTAAAIACTMAELDKHHPLTRHLSVAYWKGGDERVERALYAPQSVEKIVAWGGSGSIRHVQRFLQPGIDLITFEPKHGRAIIGSDAAASEAALGSAAECLARDIGVLNQEACFCCRVAYFVCGTDADGLDRANELGRLTYEALQRLPKYLSARSPLDPDLAMEVDAVRLIPNEFRVFGAARDEGAIVVSQASAPVDFAHRLCGRVGNIVPVASAREAVAAMDASAQTVGVYPESLKRDLRDQLAYHGVQRVVSLGAAAEECETPAPQDGIEPLRRMCRWIVEEDAVATAYSPS